MNERELIKGKTDKVISIAIPLVLIIAGVLCFVRCVVDSDDWETFFVLSIVLVILGVLSFLYLSRCEMVVTDKRIYGKAAFGKRVDLPLDSISAVATSAFNGIAVSTSSGRIMFLCMSNKEDLYKSISGLLMERQGKGKQKQTVTQIRQEIPQSNADELKKYKELLDSGVISQDEFEAKKKQLLGL